MTDRVTVVVTLDIPRATEATEEGVLGYVEWAISEMPGCLDGDDWRRNVRVVETGLVAPRRRAIERGPRHGWDSSHEADVAGVCRHCGMERSSGGLLRIGAPSVLFWRPNAMSDWIKITPDNPMPPCQS